MDVYLRYFLFFSLGLIPILLWMYLYFSYDTKNKEPKSLIREAFFWGAVSTLPVLGIFQLWKYFIPTDFFSLSLVFQILFVAVIEEMSKHLFAMKVMFSDKRAYNEASDFILYAIVVALGFSCIENLMYATDYIVNGNISWETLLGFSLRGIITTFGHTVFSSIFAILCYYSTVNGTSHTIKNILSRCTFKNLTFAHARSKKKDVTYVPHHPIDFIFEGLWAAVLVHSIFNIFLTVPLFTQNNVYAFFVPVYLFILGVFVFKSYKKISIYTIRT